MLSILFSTSSRRFAASCWLYSSGFFTVSDHPLAPVTGGRISFRSDDPGIRHVYAPVGFCIYCGRSDGVDLDVEHIFPAGLGGKHELPKASCRDCAVITGRLEQQLLRGPLWPLRVRLGIHSGRRPGDQPTDFDVKFWRGNESIAVRMAANDMPAVLLLPTLGGPTILTGEDPLPNGRFREMSIVGIGVDPMEEIQKSTSSQRLTLKSGYTAMQLPPMVDAYQLSRFAAKVVHGFAYGKLGSGSFRPLLSDLILGQGNVRSSLWVGTGPAFKEPPPSTHLLALWSTEKDGKSLLLGGMAVFASNYRHMLTAVVGELL